MLRHLHSILAFLSRAVLARYRPKIVAVAGSVGKTSTTRAVAAALARSFPTRASVKNHNNEIGVPLTILGEALSGGRSPFAWIGIFWRGFRLAFGPARSYPKVLVLEMATDHPGDLVHLVAIAPPDVSVLTAVAEEHTEFLGDLDGVAEEEGTIIRALGEDDAAILNADDPRVAGMAEGLKARAVTFGFAATADVRAERVESELALGTVFTRFNLRIGEVSFPVNLPGAIGDGNVYAALAGAAVASALGVEAALIPYGLAEYAPPPGRLRALSGIKGTTLIDDTYNSSPRAAELALATFRNLPVASGGRRVVALGDMLELGALSEEAHRRIGVLAAREAEILIGVGPISAFLCQAAKDAGMPEERIFHMPNAAEAGRFLQERLHAGDLVLIKGSQGMRMEKIVKELMAEPERARELLVRQEAPWDRN